MLIVAVLLRCHALPPDPRRFNGPTLVAVANAKALQLPLPPNPGWLVSTFLWSCVMLWATSGSPRTHGIERGRNHPSVRDAR